jgi:hypothetical protein
MKKIVTVIALLLVASCGSSSSTTGGGSTGGTSAYPEVAQDCVNRINAFRATIGLMPLMRWTDGEACADTEAQSDAESGTPHGAFGQCSEFAQNECPDYDSTDRIIDVCLQFMWNEGPGGGHYDNMTNTSYAEVACGFYQMASGLWWSVQNFR